MSITDRFCVGTVGPELARMSSLTLGGAVAVQRETPAALPSAGDRFAEAEVRGTESLPPLARVQ